MTDPAEPTPSPFDPDWRDDVYSPRALAFDLALPTPTPPDGTLWVMRRHEREEMAFGRYHHRHDPPRPITAIVTRAPRPRHLSFQDEQGRTVEASNPIYDIAFPPKAWMSDTLEERCMMLAAAEVAVGDVLVGGLGLAVYPQLVLLLGRPVRSITIVEESEAVIELIHPSWMRRLSEADRSRVRVVHQPVQRFLAASQERFDTLFLDVWPDADPRWLPFVNGLIERATPRCAGAIQCWGYASMVDAFVRDAWGCVERGFPLSEFNLDPALERFAARAEAHPGASREVVEDAARQIARSVSTQGDSYDAGGYLSVSAPSRWMGRLQLHAARKGSPG